MGPGIVPGPRWEGHDNGECGNGQRRILSDIVAMPCFRPKVRASAQLASQRSIFRPLMSSPVSSTLNSPSSSSLIRSSISLFSGNTRGSAATIPSRTSVPVRVVPRRQYAVIETGMGSPGCARNRGGRFAAAAAILVGAMSTGGRSLANGFGNESRRRATGALSGGRALNRAESASIFAPRHFKNTNAAVPSATARNNWSALDCFTRCAR